MKTVNPARLSTLLEARQNALIASDHIAGSSILVTQGGKKVYQGCFGTCDEAFQQPITPRTLFRIASMTKATTAVAVMIARDRGLIDLDAPIADYLPMFSSMNITALNEKGEEIIVRQAEHPILVRHILTHTSGMGSGPCMPMYYERPALYEAKSLRAAMDFYATLGLSFDPGSANEYSGVLGFDLLAAAVEVVTGEEFEAFLKKNVFEPCRMPDTVYRPTKAQWDRVCAMHIRKEGKSQIRPMWEGCVFEDYPMDHCMAGAGLLSCPEDYTHFALMLLRGGSFEGHRILSPESVRMMTSPQISVELMPGKERWGFGGRVITAQDDRLPATTFGWSGSYGTHFWVDYVNQITAVYMKNSDYDSGSGAQTAAWFEEDVMASLE